MISPLGSLPVSTPRGVVARSKSQVLSATRDSRSVLGRKPHTSHGSDATSTN